MHPKKVIETSHGQVLLVFLPGTPQFQIDEFCAQEHVLRWCEQVAGSFDNVRMERINLERFTNKEGELILYTANGTAIGQTREEPKRTLAYNIMLNPDCVQSLVLLRSKETGEEFLVTVEQLRLGPPGLSTEFPGGLVSDGCDIRSLARAAKQEICEEAGIEGTALKIHYIGAFGIDYPASSVRTHFFYGEMEVEQALLNEMRKGTQCFGLATESESTRLRLLPLPAVVDAFLGKPDDIDDDASKSIQQLLADNNAVSLLARFLALTGRMQISTAPQNPALARGNDKRPEA